MYILVYIYNTISVLSCWFCQFYISRLQCKQLQLKHEGRWWTQRQMLKKTERERKTGDTGIQQTECISLQKILEYLNDHMSERSRRQNTTFSEPNWRRVDSELNFPSKWGELTTYTTHPTAPNPNPNSTPTVQTLYSSVKPINQLWNYHIFTIVPSCIIGQLQSITKNR